jgi:MoaA/NifB/PqqE/SkfB family radical SAM enzyme
MAAIRAKTDGLIQLRPLDEQRAANSALNVQEMYAGAKVLHSRPQRLVFELTSACNLNCIMCGRSAAAFQATMFDFNWFQRFEQIMGAIEEVTLMGWGEPTLHPRFADMLRFLRAKNVRAYFCTNGMRLDELRDIIFDCEVEVLAVSLDGRDAPSNQRLRPGLDFKKLINALQKITLQKQRSRLAYPHINFVMTMMKSNIEQLPAMVDLAADLGLNEVKGVFLTAFKPELIAESLYNHIGLTRSCFERAERRAQARGILLKLPHLPGQDPAGTAAHKPCRAAWRDFFLGSDGYVRACMSSPDKLFHIDQYQDFAAMWNSREYQGWRGQVNVPGAMSPACARCYQSSFANWNQEHAFIQAGNKFAPEWESRKAQESQ